MWPWKKYVRFSLLISQSMSTDTIRIAVVEDLRTLRDGYRALIDGTEGYRCVGTYRTMEEALGQIGQTLPDVVLVDIGLPGMNGIDGARILKERWPALVVVMLTVYNDDERIFDALCAGACGYLLKKTPPARLLEAIREATQGGAPMSPEVARKVVALFREVRPPGHVDYQLTAHETRLLKLLAEGNNYKSAAAELGISINTVCFHVKQVYQKLHVHSKSQAVAKALRQRIIR